MTGKIFGIGFPRTGTTSLVTALNRLGVRSIHNPLPLLANVDDPLLHAYDGFADNPVPLIYPDLDLRFPRSKFILTDRNENEWLSSVEWMISMGRKHGGWDEKPAIVEMHRLLYGASEFDRDRYLDRFRRHRAEVLVYFKNRPDDLLVLDVTRGDGWNRLCPFLGLPMPDDEFPHDNPRVHSLGATGFRVRLRRILRALGATRP